MGKATDHIIELIKKQVNESHLVVWFDPKRDYYELVNNLPIDNIKMMRYTGSFFALRYEVDQMMKETEPPNLIIYVPMAEEDTDYALIGYIKSGVVMKPGQSPWQRNTRLAVIAKHALKEIVGEERIATIEKQVEEGSLKLSDLDKIAEGDGEISDIISIIFSSKNIQDITLRFINDTKYDKELEQKNAIADLATLFKGSYDLDIVSDKSLKDYRAYLIRHVLTTELLSVFKEGTPEQLKFVSHAIKENEVIACIELVTTWRNRRDLHDNYAIWADKIENVLGIKTIKFNLSQIKDNETFGVIEIKNQEYIEQALANNVTRDMVDIASKRKHSFWSDQKPQLKARWILIESAGNLLLTCNKIEQELKEISLDSTKLIKRYVEGEEPWCLIDYYHRHMESQVHDFDEEGRTYKDLSVLITRARQRYMIIGGLLSEAFLKVIKQEEYHKIGIQPQTKIYNDYVIPALKSGKTAYILVDALRYEMARELISVLNQDYSNNLKVAIATIPTITEVGMASLMPNNGTNLKLGTDRAGKLGLSINGHILTDRESRLKYLKENIDVSAYAIKLENILSPTVPKSIEKSIEQSDLIIVTSQEVDMVGESDNIPLARRYMNEIIRDIRRILRYLTAHGIKTIIVSADHGYIFGEKLDTDTKIPPPGGDTIALHRRAWVGHGGASSSSYVRFTEKDLGLSGNFEIAVPNGFGAFISGGATSYFHGGISLQEMVIPVAIITPTVHDEEYPGDFAWTIKLGSKKITTRISSIQIDGTLKSISSISPPTIRIEIRNNQGCVSKPISAFYGYEEATGDVKLIYDQGSDRKVKSNNIIVSIAPEVKKDIVSIHLLDATTGRELARIENVEVSITI